MNVKLNDVRVCLSDLYQASLKLDKNTVEMFATKECPKCSKLSDLLNRLRVKHVKRFIDIDPDAETDALMYNIISVPALKYQKRILFKRDIFTKDQINEDKVLAFLEIKGLKLDSGIILIHANSR